MKKTELVLGVAAAALSVTGCSTLNQATGGGKVVPDEFKVVTKAPLVVPPEYALRPPEPGSSRPRELQADTGRAIVFGQDVGAEASPGERLLVAQSGAMSTDPNIRSIIDYDEAGIVRKNRNFIEQVIEYSPLQSGTEPVLQGEPIDAEAEERRLTQLRSIESATGGGQVVIERGGGPRVKLPGT